MTWEIIAALIAIVTVGIAIGKVIANLSQTLTKLSCAVDALSSTLNMFMSNSNAEHKAMHKDIDHLKEDVNKHEIRIENLEEKK